MSDVGPFAALAPRYRELGYWPRPVAPGTKAPPMKGWQRPDTELASGVLADWLARYGACGIGLVMGSPLPDGSALGAVDIDRDDYVRLARALLCDPPSGKIGAHGATFFVRLLGDVGLRKITAKSEEGPLKIGDLLVRRQFCVLPPTMHPSTGLPYRWIGTPLLEVPFTDLPVLEVR